MQILSISDVYYPRVCDTSISLRTMTAELRAKGHGVTLLAPDYPDTHDVPGEDLIRVSSYSLGSGRADRAMKIHRVLELSDRLRSWGYDVVHIHTPYIAHVTGIALAHRLGIPVVETWNTFYQEQLARRFPRLNVSWRMAAVRMLSRLQSRGVDGLIALSAETRDRLRGYGIDKPITIVPPGIETHLFRRGDGARFRSARAIEPDRPVLLRAGELRRREEAEFLLAVLDEVRQKIPKVLLLVAGEGPEKNHWQTVAERFGIDRHVVFVGEPDRTKELLDCYGAADCLVFADNMTAQGIVLVEAMSAGLPVVAIPSARAKDILAADSPAVVTPAITADFAAQVIRMLSDAAWREARAAAAREYAQRWSASVTVEQVLDCYREVIALRGQPMRALAR